MDSLWAVWQNDIIPNESRAKALCNYAKEYAKKSTDSSLFYATQAYDFATNNELDYFRSFAKEIIGTAYYRKGAFNEAEIAYNEGIEIARFIGDSTLVANNLYSIGTVYNDRGDYDTALKYYTQSVPLMEGQGDNLSMANVVNNMGIIYIRKGNYEQATLALERSIDLYKNSKDPSERSGPMINLAILKSRQGDYSSAIDLYTRSMAIDEQAGNEFNVAYSYLNIASLYYRQGDHEKFFEHANNSLKIREKLGDKAGIVRCLSNIGAVHYEDKQLERSLYYLEKCLPLAEELDLKNTIGHVVLTLGSIQVDQGNYSVAFEYMNRALSIYEELGIQLEIARCYGAFGKYYEEVGNRTRAINFYSKAYELSKDSDINLTKEISLELYRIYQSTSNTRQTLKYYELYIAARDSIESAANKREIIRQEYKYTYEKKALADSLSFSNERKIQQTKLEKTQSQRQSLFLLLIIVLGFSFLLITRNRTINNQKQTIQNQNSELHDLNENLEEKVADRTKELKESGERYTYALEASSDGIWDYNVKSDIIKYSPAIYTMLGFEPYEFPETREAIYKLLHSEDIKIAKSKLHNLFLIENKEEFLADEYRLIGKDGTSVWVQVKGKVVERDDNNNPIRIVGTHTNITESKLRHKETLAAILRTEDAERSRISKDIHDGLQQTLTISFLNFNGLKKHIKNLTGEFKEKYNLGWEYLQKSIVESREVAHTLMPKSIIDYGVLSACQRLIDDMNTSNDKTEFSFYHNLKSERLPNHQIEITLYRILQESLNNIVKYAKATNVDIQLKDYDDMYMLTIEDNGIGFDTELLKKEGEGLGFVSMKNRLDAINGSLEIDSEIGEGTTVLVHIDKAEY